MSIIEESKQYVKDLFEEKGRKEISYHNWDHTKNVIEAVTILSENTPGVGDKDKENLQIAAIFHDIGYIETRDGHEDVSKRIAEEFLREKKVPQDQIDVIKKMINATKIKVAPENLLEEILIDADLSHLGKTDYFETTYKKLANELSTLENENMSDYEWAERCEVFLSAHNYLTDYAREIYSEEKNRNLNRIKELLAAERSSEKTDEEKIIDTVEKVLDNRDQKDKEDEKEKKEKNTEETDEKGSELIEKDSRKLKNPLKGVETMFKASLRNHVNLSRIADNKANTLISVNAIIVSIVLSALFPKLDSNPYLFYPGITILTSCIITIIISILSTIPNVNRGIITKEEVKEKKGNLIFFGNFFKMKQDDYEWSMNILMNDKEYLYTTLTRDLYFLGKVLHKKYILLRWSYYVFVAGLLVSIAVFVYNVLPYMDATQVLK